MGEYATKASAFGSCCGLCQNRFLAVKPVEHVLPHAGGRSASVPHPLSGLLDARMDSRLGTSVTC